MLELKVVPLQPSQGPQIKGSTVSTNSVTSWETKVQNINLSGTFQVYTITQVPLIQSQAPPCKVQSPSSFNLLDFIKFMVGKSSSAVTLFQTYSLEKLTGSGKGWSCSSAGRAFAQHAWSPGRTLSNANQAWWNMMVTPGLMRYKQKDQKFEVIRGYITSLRPTKLHEELLTPPSPPPVPPHIH